MKIETTQDMEKIIKEYANSSDGDWYFIINKEFVDGIEKWLWEYTYSPDGWWLNYKTYPIQNEEQMYVLQLYGR